MKFHTPEEQGHIQATVRSIPGSERAFRNATKNWSTEDFDYALERVEFDVPTHSQGRAHTLIQQIRSERAQEEFAIRLQDRQMERMLEANPKTHQTSRELNPSRERLVKLRDQGNAMLARGIDDGKEFQIWATAFRDEIANAFGRDSGHLTTYDRATIDARVAFANILQSPPPSFRALEAKHRIAVVDLLIPLLPETGGDSSARTILLGGGAWEDMHPGVSSVSRQLFEHAHTAQAVHAAYTALAGVVKGALKARKGVEDDGASLMYRAFGGDLPQFRLADLSTESGRNFQKGHLAMLTGAMTGIRNPVAHDITILDADTALGQLQVCSYLWKVVGPALDQGSPGDSFGTPPG